MKNFLKIFLIILIFLVVFFFFGGFILFDFSRNFWLATVMCAFVASIIVFAFEHMSEKIEILEKKIEELQAEKKDV